MPSVTPAAKRKGQLVNLFNSNGRGRLGFRSQAIATMTLDFEGIIGNRHRGWTRQADARVPYLKRGTMMRNTRQLSIVSIEDCALIAQRLGLPLLDPTWIGANIATQGIAQLSFLPRGTRLFFEGGLILAVEDQNAPCTIAGESVQLANPEQAHIKSAFVLAAKGLRGVVATVEHPGQVTVGCTIAVRLPEQWIYR